MDGRLQRGLILLIIGGGLVWFGKGIFTLGNSDKVMGNAMIIGGVAGLYMLALSLASLYDFATRAQHE